MMPPIKSHLSYNYQVIVTAALESVEASFDFSSAFKRSRQETTSRPLSQLKSLSETRLEKEKILRRNSLKQRVVLPVTLSYIYKGTPQITTIKWSSVKKYQSFFNFTASITPSKTIIRMIDHREKSLPWNAGVLSQRKTKTYRKDI